MEFVTKQHISELRDSVSYSPGDHNLKLNEMLSTLSHIVKPNLNKPDQCNG